MAHDVFISYSTHDKLTADALCATLEAKGIRCWIAPRDIVAGTQWGEAIIEALQSSRVMVLVFSSHANGSQQIRRELERAVDRGLIIIPVRIENVVPAGALEYFIGQVHWLDALTVPLDTHLHKLAEDVRLLLSKPGQAQEARAPEDPRVEVTEPTGQDAPVQPEAPQAFPTHAPRAARRQRMVAGAVMGWALLLLAGMGGWYWDAYLRTHVDYYANVTTRWGLPEGIGRLTDEQVSHRNTTLAFTKRGRHGPVHDIRAVNSRGMSPPMFGRSASFLWGDLNPLEQEQVGYVSESLATCRVTFERAAGGQVLNQRAHNCASRELYRLHYAHPGWAAYKEEARDKAVRESGIAHLQFVWAESGPEAGLASAVLFFDRDGKPQPDRDGIYGYHQGFDEDGRVVERIALGEDRQPTVSRDGIARMVYRRDALGNVTRITNLGRDGQPVLDSSGAAEVQMAYDPYGNTKEITAFGTDGQLVTLKSMGAAGRTVSYDTHGNVVENTWFGPNRHLVTGKLGFAKQRVVWDAEGRSRESFFGPDGELILLFDRVATARGVWDARGYLVKAVHFDEHDHPVRNDHGCVKVHMTHDDQGNLAEWACFDEMDHLVRDTNGMAKVKRRYDARGNATEALYFGPHGRPEYYEERYVKVRSTYNPQGKVVEQVYLDPADHPVPTSDGYAKFTYTYDLQGQLTEAAFFDAQDQLTRRTGGYAQKRRTYDARRNLTAEIFLDPQGNPVRHDDGYAKATFAYDDRGYRIEQAYFDEHGQPTVHTDGNATRRSKYNERGQLLEHTYYGLDGAPVLLKEFGFATVRRTYDARGKVSQVIYFGPDDRLVQTAYGFAIIKLVYDSLGRETTRQFFDVDGVPVHTRVAIWKFEPSSNGPRLGLNAGDLLLNYDGEDIGNTHIFRELELVRGERRRELRLQRQGKVVSLTVPPGRLRGLDLVDRVPFGSNRAGL